MYIITAHKSLENIKFKFKCSNIIMYIIAAGVIIELIVNACNNIEALRYNTSDVRNEDYSNAIKINEEIYGKVKENDTSFYRLESKNSMGVNDALFFGFNGMNFSSSAFSRKLYVFLINMGYSQIHVTVASDTGNTKTADMIFGIKYLINRDDIAKDKEYEETIIDKNVLAYKNPYALNLGFIVTDEILEEWEMGNLPPFENQENFVKKFSGLDENIFTRHENSITEKVENLAKKDDEYEKIDKEESAKVIQEFTAEKNESVYLYILR